VSLRLARVTGGGVDYWLELPLHELMRYVIELVEQITQEAEQQNKGR
jgi:hypothetical protein